VSEVAVALPRPASGLGFHGRMLRSKPLGAVGGIVFLVFLLCGIFADVLAPYGVNETDLAHRLEGPSWQFLFGTDHLGRDVFSRILAGAQLSMIVAFLAAGFATVVSLAIGVVSGYVGGKTDMTIQRGVDAWNIAPVHMGQDAILFMADPNFTETECFRPISDGVHLNIRHISRRNARSFRRQCDDRVISFFMLSDVLLNPLIECWILKPLRS
jgi:peptide/nickel transport system permease protein